MGAVARLTTKPKLGSPSRPSAAQSRPAIAPRGGVRTDSEGPTNALGPMQSVGVLGCTYDYSRAVHAPIAGNRRAVHAPIAVSIS